MPVYIQHTDENGVIFSAHGKLLFSEIKRALESTPAGSFHYQLYDYSQVNDFLLSSGDMVKIARIDKQRANLHADSLFAAIGSHDLIYGLNRIWHANLDLADERCSVFRELEEAQNWVKLNLKI